MIYLFSYRPLLRATKELSGTFFFHYLRNEIFINDFVILLLPLLTAKPNINIINKLLTNKEDAR